MKIIVLSSFIFSWFACYCQLSKQELNQLAIERYNVGDFKGADGYFKKITEQYPNDSMAYLDCGMMKEYMKDFQGAIEDFTKQIQVDEASVDGYFLRAINEEKLGFFDAALRDYSSVIKLEFDNSDAHLFRGMIYLKNNQKKEALIDLRFALAINPENSNALAERGWYFALEGNFKNAMTDLDKAISIDSSLQKAYQYRGWVKTALKDYLGAISDYEKMISINPYKFPEYYQLEKQPHDLSHFDKILNNKQKYCKSEKEKMDLALLNMFLKRTKQANQIFKEIVFNSENYVLDLFGISKTNFLLGNPLKEALTPLNFAINEDPTIPELFFFRAELNLKMNNETQACLDFERYKMLSKEFIYLELFKKCINKA